MPATWYMGIINSDIKYKSDYIRAFYYLFQYFYWMTEKTGSEKLQINLTTLYTELKGLSFMTFTLCYFTFDCEYGTTER